MKNKYLFYTDTHLDKKFPWTLWRFVRHLRKENPKGIFLTGDISNGLLTCFHLKMLAKAVECPIYFVLGNHDMHFSSFEKTHAKIRKLCQEHPNLIWMTEAPVIELSSEVAVIGAEGWYDAMFGNPNYLKATFDWFLTEDFRKLPNWNARIDAFRKLADKSCDIIADKLEKALEQGYKTIYILSHFPPWKEATRDEGTFLESYYLPYNVNYRLGQTIEKIMEGRKKRNVIVLSGHTHTPEYIRVSRNISCQVGDAKIFKINSQQIYL